MGNCDLEPKSSTSTVVLPATGTAGDVADTLAYGIYTTDAFLSGASDQVAYVYNKLGGNILNLELTPSNVYNSYEESCLEYSYLLNTHQAKNVLSDLLGGTTGSFDEDGEFVTPQVNAALKLPRFTFSYPQLVAQGASAEAGMGGNQRVYSASVDIVADKQDYDLQDAVYSASLEAGSLFSGSIGQNKVTIEKIFFKTPRATWRFFGGSGPLGVGNLSTYGMYADDSQFEVIPVWQNQLQANAYEHALKVRGSHYSYELKNNHLRVFPVPNTTYPEKLWFYFRATEEAYEEEDGRRYGADGVNNMNALPFPNFPYNKINSIGKQWIRRFALSLAKETLGQVRSKLASIPIPGSEVTLNGPALISEAKEEQLALRDELKEVFDDLSYQKLAEGDAALHNATIETLTKVPHGIFVG
jgi:hypothetical protein